MAQKYCDNTSAHAAHGWDEWITTVIDGKTTQVDLRRQCPGRR